MTKLPKTIFVTKHEGDGRDDPYLLADEDLQRAVKGSDDDPAIVGEYKLVGINK